MSLNWSVEKVVGQEEKCFVKNSEGKEDVNPITKAIVFSTMFVGVPDITKKTALEYIKRLRIWQSIFGAMMVKDGKPYDITAQQVVDHIGLTTNANRKSRTEFIKSIWNTLDLEVKYERKDG